jgi:hypothetical protein
MTRLRVFGRLVLTLLRELADENAYRRYLAANGRLHSAEEWRAFSDRRLRVKYSKAKCC